MGHQGVRIIAKLEMTLTTAQQNKEQIGNPHKTMGATINKLSPRNLYSLYSGPL